MTPKRGAYPPAVRKAAVRALRQGRSLRDVADEFGTTLGTLRVWLHVAEGGVHGPIRTRELVLAGTVAAFDRLDGFLRSIPISDLDTPMAFGREAFDPWLAKDAVAHVAHYKAREVDRLMRRRSTPGGRLTAVERKMHDYFDPESWDELAASDPVFRSLDPRTRRRHGLNHLVYVRWRDAPADEIVAWHRTVQKYVVAAFENGPDAWFVEGGQRASRNSISRAAVGALAAHSDTHLRDIRKTLSARPS